MSLIFICISLVFMSFSNLYRCEDYLDETDIDSEKMTPKERENFWEELQNKWQDGESPDNLPWSHNSDFGSNERFKVL